MLQVQHNGVNERQDAPPQFLAIYCASPQTDHQPPAGECFKGDTTVENHYVLRMAEGVLLSNERSRPRMMR